MTPISKNGELTIPIALLTDLFLGYFGEYLPMVVTVTVSASAILSLFYKYTKSEAIKK